MTDSYNRYYQALIFDGIHHPVITYTNAPQILAAQLGHARWPWLVGQRPNCGQHPLTVGGWQGRNDTLHAPGCNNLVHLRSRLLARRPMRF